VAHSTDKKVTPHKRRKINYDSNEQVDVLY